MALSTVTLHWDLTDLIQAGLSATLSITPTAQMSDTADHVLIPPVPVTFTFPGGTGQLAGIVPNDSAAILPAGTGYLISVTAASGKVIVPQFQTQLLIANGADQWLDALATVPSVTTSYQYLPLPSGTPSAGQVPVATGTGEASAWGPAGSGTVTTVSVVTANGLAGSVANPATAPAITLSVPETGILKSNGTAVSAAAAGTDYLAPTGSGAGLTGITAAQTGALPSTDDLSAIATANATAANVAMNSKKFTGLANGSASSDSAAYGQTPAGGNTVTIGQGGTGQTSAAAAYNALSPMTAKGDMEYDSAAGTASRLAVGSAGQVLGVSAGVPAWAMGLTLLATTGLTGYALVNGTGTIISWTAPSDGAMHRVEIIGLTVVTSAETGGGVNVQYTDMGGNAQNAVLCASGLGTGSASFNNALNRTMILLPSGGTVSVVQAGALTAGAAKFWAEIWGS